MAQITETLVTLGQRLSGLLSGRMAVDPSDTSRIFRFVDDAYQYTADDRTETQKLRDFFEGDQIRGTGLNDGTVYIPDWIDEDDTDKDTRADRMEALTYNRVRDGVLAHADALYAWGRERAVNRRIEWDEDAEASEEQRTQLDRYFQRAWRDNRIAKFMWEVWRTAGTEKLAVVMLDWVDTSSRRYRKFPAGTPRSRMQRYGIPWLELCDNLQTIVLPHDTQARTPGAVIRWYTESRDDTIVLENPYPGERNTITELVTDDLWIRWRGRKQEDTEWGTANRYGDVRSIFVVAENPGMISDAEDGVNPQTMLNEWLYNMWQVFQSHGFPDVLYRGFTPQMEEVAGGLPRIVRGPHIAHVAPDSPQADIIKRGAPDGVDLDGEQKIIHGILDEALGLSFTERSSGGDFGQLRSAPAIARTQARSERRRRRKLIWALDFEEELFESMRDVATYHWFGSRDDREVFRASRLVVTYPEDAFTLDAYTEAQRDAVETQEGFVSRRDQIRKRNPSMSESEIAALEAEIEEDLQTTAGNGASSPGPNATERANAQMNT